MKQRAIQNQKILFSAEALAEARKLGFVVIQLLLSREKMESRNKYRMEHDGWDDISMYFKYMIDYQEEIKKKGVVDKEINADQPVKIIAKEVLETLKNHS